MLWLIRTVLRVPQPKVSREQAIGLACKECDDRGWPHNHPKAVEELRTWLIWMNSEIKGGPYIAIDNQTGNVVRSGRPTR